MGRNRVSDDADHIPTDPKDVRPSKATTSAVISHGGMAFLLLYGHCYGISSDSFVGRLHDHI